MFAVDGHMPRRLAKHYDNAAGGPDRSGVRRFRTRMSVLPESPLGRARPFTVPRLSRWPTILSESAPRRRGEGPVQHTFGARILGVRSHFASRAEVTLV